MKTKILKPTKRGSLELVMHMCKIHTERYELSKWHFIKHKRLKDEFEETLGEFMLTFNVFEHYATLYSILKQYEHSYGKNYLQKELNPDAKLTDGSLITPFSFEGDLIDGGHEIFEGTIEYIVDSQEIKVDIIQHRPHNTRGWQFIVDEKGKNKLSKQNKEMWITLYTDHIPNRILNLLYHINMIFMDKK